MTDRYSEMQRFPPILCDHPCSARVLDSGGWSCSRCEQFCEPPCSECAALAQPPAPASADAALNLLRWVESLPENSDGLVWVTKAELRAVIDTREAAIRGTEAGLDAVRAALVSEDEIAHGEASDGVRGLGECAYCDMPWPCRTQRGIDRLLARLSSADTETP